MMKSETEAVVAEVTQLAQELLQWSEDHPGCTLRELEERVQKLRTLLGARLLETAVALQGAGEQQEEHCSCRGGGFFRGIGSAR